MVTKSFRNYAVAAALTFAAMAVGSAPAFAWGGGAPDNYYPLPTNQAPSQVHGQLYNYVSPSKAAPATHAHRTRSEAVEQR
jgi:hypothetical protein